MSRLHSVQPRAERAHRPRQVAQQPREVHVETPWLHARQALAYLGLGSRTALGRLIVDHRLPYHRLGTRLWFHRAELDAWLLATGSGPAPTAHR